MTESRLDIGLVEHVAILSLEELAGQEVTSRVSLLVQLTEARLERDRGFSRGRGQVGPLICNHDWSGWNNGQSGEIVSDICALTVVVGSKMYIRPGLCHPLLTLVHAVG